MPMAMKEAVTGGVTVVLLTIQDCETVAATAAGVIEYPVGNPPCIMLPPPTSLQLSTGAPFVVAMLRAA